MAKYGTLRVVTLSRFCYGWAPVTEGRMTDHEFWGPIRPHMSRDGTAAAHVGARDSRVSAGAGTSAWMLAIAILLSGSPGGCASTGIDADAHSPDIGTLNARLGRFAYEQLSFKLERSRPLSPPAQQAIDAFVASGARRLHADGATEQGISEAEANLERFVSGLSEAANTSEAGDITPETVEATRNRLCPLNPFC